MADIILNGGFETWSGSPSRPDNWTWNGTSGRIAQETSIIKEGASALRISGESFSDINNLIQTIDATPYRGMSITLTGWGCQVSIGTNTRFALSTDGTSPINETVDVPKTYPIYNEVSIGGTVPADATVITVQYWRQVE